MWEAGAVAARGEGSEDGAFAGMAGDDAITDRTITMSGYRNFIGVTPI
jgi:hypothetical protein